MHWRRNGAKLSKRKAIREECHRRVCEDRDDQPARDVYRWVHVKIRRFYDHVPLDAVHRIRRAT